MKVLIGFLLVGYLYAHQSVLGQVELSKKDSQRELSMSFPKELFVRMVKLQHHCEATQFYRDCANDFIQSNFQMTINHIDGTQTKVEFKKIFQGHHLDTKYVTLKYSYQANQELSVLIKSNLIYPHGSHGYTQVKVKDLSTTQLYKLNQKSKQIEHQWKR